jgi:4-methylaminobutanoate oxidase (formaldehyde-forming)
MAEWIVQGAPSIDVSEMNVRRFGAYLRDRDYVAAKAREIYRYYYLLRYPNDQDEWGRDKRLAPLYETVKACGAVFGAKNGWERVNYFDAGKPWRRAGADQRQWGWSRPPYFETVGAEHRAAREQVALFDMTSFGKLDVRGAGALSFLQYLADNDVDKPVGSLTYTQFLNERGGIESDLTIARLGQDHFRLVTGTAFLDSDLGWMRLCREKRDLNLEQVEFRDVTAQFACLGLWGPRARCTLETVTGDDVSNSAFPYMTARWLDITGMRVWAQRVSYVGELGWELYCANADAPALWRVLMEAGKPFGITPAGYFALDTLRLEKCYRYWSTDITPGETPLESGQGFAVKWRKGDFLGRDALLLQKGEGIRRKLVPLTLNFSPSDRSLAWGEGMIYGGEAIWYDKRVISRVRSGGYGYTLGKTIALGYLPVELTQPGTTVHVELFGERVPAQVAPDPLYDPQGTKLRA